MDFLLYLVSWGKLNFSYTGLFDIHGLLLNVFSVVFYCPFKVKENKEEWGWGEKRKEKEEMKKEEIVIETETHRGRYKDKELQSLSIEEHCCVWCNPSYILFQVIKKKRNTLFFLKDTTLKYSPFLTELYIGWCHFRIAQLLLFISTFSFVLVY